MRKFLFVLAVCMLAACGSGGSKGASSTTTTDALGAPGLTPTTGIGSAMGPPTTGAGAVAKSACSLLTEADVEAALFVKAGPPTPAGSAPKQFASGGTGTIDNCSYHGAGDTKVDVALVTAKDAADARTDFEDASGAIGSDVLLHDNNAYVFGGNKFATITVLVDFDAEAPAGVDLQKREETDAYIRTVLLGLVTKVKSGL